MADEKIWGRWDLKINGTPVEGDTQAILQTDLEDIPAKLPWWYHILAEAQYEAEQVQIHYRRWFGQFATNILKKDPKISEWKIKAKSQAEPDFWSYKEAMAQAHRNVTMVNGVIEGLKAKLPRQ
jgi:hypothetical protein